MVLTEIDDSTMSTPSPTSSVLLASTNGYGFVCRLGDLTATKRAGKQFITLDAGGKRLACSG